MPQPQHQFSKAQRVAFVGGLTAFFGYLLFTYTGLGGTVMNLPLRIQPQAENGLVGYWSFDSFDTLSASAEVLDESGQDNHGNIVNNASTSDVVIDSNVIATSTAYTGTSPRTVFVSRNDGYTFYPDNGTCFAASTTDGGLTWGGPTIVDSANTNDCIRVAVWYDGWTPTAAVGATTTTSTKIHIATMDTSVDDIYYTEFDFSTSTGRKMKPTTLTVTQGSANLETDTFLSITRAGNGWLYVSLFDAADRFILRCQINCTSGGPGNWAEIAVVGTPDEDQPLLLPVPSTDNVMQITFDITANDYLSNVYSATSSTWWATTTIDANAVEGITYDAHFGGTVDWNANRIYLAYAADNNDFSTQDHDLRFASYDVASLSWTPTTIASNIASRFITDVKVAFDEIRNIIYVVYAAGTSAAANQRVYYRTSSDGGTTWSAEQGPIDGGATDWWGGANISIMGENIYNVRFASTTGAYTTDLVGNSISAPFGNYAFETGRIGQAYWFDGVDDYITMGDPGSGVLDLGDQDMTLAAWIYPEDENIFRPIIAKVTSASEKEYALVVQSANQLQFEIETSGNGSAVLSPDNTVPKNQWSHVAATYNDATREVKLYINGVEQSTTGSILADPVNFAQDLQIGSFDYNSTFFKGGIDEVRIYDRILPASEISRIYSLGATTKVNTTLDTQPTLDSGLVLHYSFDGPSVASSTDRLTSEITDDSGEGNAGDWRNHASTTGPGAIGSAIEFDGTNDDIDAGSAAELDNLGRATPMSFAAWIYPYTDGEGDGTYGGVIATKGTGDGWWVSMSENPVNAIRWTYGCGGTALFKTTAANTIRNKEWTHVVVTSDGSVNESDNTRIYINGAEPSYFESIDCGSTLDDDASFVMTVGGNFGASTFDGKIDDVRVYNRELSPEDVSRLYKLGATSKLNTTVHTQSAHRDTLVAHWTMDGRDVVTLPASVTSEVKDRSVENITMDWINHSSTTVPGRIGQGLYFDGIDDYASSTQLPLTAATIGQTSWTVMLWAKPETFTQSNAFNRTALSQANANNGTPRRWIEFGTDGDIITNHNGTLVSFGQRANLNEWVHVTMVFDEPRDYLIFYVNGEYTGVDQSASLDGGDGPMLLGTLPARDAGFFQGVLDDFRMYESALPTSTIQSIYQLGS